MANPNQDARGNKSGRYIRTPEAIARDAEAAHMYGQGHSYREIAEHFGWAHHTSARDAVRRASREILRGPAQEVLDLHVSRLEWAYGKAVEIAEAEHVVVSHGKVITMTDPETGEEKPLHDSAPILAALREARSTLESFRKLVGADAPARVSVDAQQLGDEILSLLDQAAPPADDADG